MMRGVKQGIQETRDKYTGNILVGNSEERDNSEDQSINRSAFLKWDTTV